MNAAQAKRVVCAWVAGNLLLGDGFDLEGMSEGDRLRLAEAADALGMEMLRRSRREYTSGSLDEIITDEVSKHQRGPQ